MRIRTGVFLLLSVVVGLGPFAQQTAYARRIDATKGREYTLTKRHGPWMITVATFRPIAQELRVDGMSPEDAAAELVYELRRKGIPAYTYGQGEMTDQLETVDRLGRPQHGKYRAQDPGICVLAGNYPSAEDDVAQKTLAYVKRFQPVYLRDVVKSGEYVQKLKNGGIFLKTPGQPGALSGAFLTVNPLLTPEEARAKKRDLLIVKLNSGMDHSLFNNPGKYTLLVASFHGKQVTLPVNAQFRRLEEAFEKGFKAGNNLDQAAIEAWELTQALRQRNIEAYVFHDRYKSVVTVGSFDTPADNRILQTINVYRAKMKEDPNTKQQVLVAEALTIPAVLGPNETPKKKWIFDPEPRLMPVPER